VGSARRARVRGLTLLEVLIVIALIALLGGTVALGPGVLASSRVRAAATLIVSGVRLGTTRANTTGRPTRLVIDMDEGRVLLEEATGRTFVRDKDDTAGGAEASTQIEKLAQEEAARILEGPRAPRARFVPVSALSDPDDPGKGRPLGSGVQIARVQTEHDPEPLSRGRAYVYFWPGGLTEHAAIHLKREGGSDEGLTVTIRALTGRATIQRGRVDLEPVRYDEDNEGLSEREED